MKKKKKGREATARPPRVCGADVDTRSVVEREIYYVYIYVRGGTRADTPRSSLFKGGEIGEINKGEEEWWRVQVERADGTTKKGQRDCKVDRVESIGRVEAWNEDTQMRGKGGEREQCYEIKKDENEIAEEKGEEYDMERRWKNCVYQG